MDFDLELETFRTGMVKTENVLETECSSGMKGFSGRRSVTSETLDVTEALDRILGVVDFSAKAICSLDTCHHFDENQILTTTKF